MATLEYHIGERGYPGFTVSTVTPAGNTYRQVVPAHAMVSSAGVELGTAAAPIVTQSSSAAATAGTNLSGTATTTSGGFNIPTSATRKPGDVQGQNISAVSIGFNEFGGTAAIGTAGTYTVAAGGTFSITTNQQVNFIAASGTAAVTITGV